MAKQKLTDIHSATEEDGCLPDISLVIEENDMTEKINKAFANFPTVDVLYHDSKEVYFSPTKQGLIAVKRENCKN